MIKEEHSLAWLSASLYLFKPSCHRNGFRRRGWVEGKLKVKTRKKTYAATGWPWGNERILWIERGNTRSHSVENCLWKGLGTCKTDYKKNDLMNCL